MGRTLSILYVEDHPDLREATALFLETLFSTVIVASDGEEGLLKYKEFRPDIVISDIQMPRMNGIDMVKKIKEENFNQYVLFVTAYTDTDYFTQAIDLQVDAYITKPVDFTKFKHKLESIQNQIITKKRNEEYVLSQQKQNISIAQYGRYVLASNTDEKGIITYITPSLCDISGYSESELLGQNHSIFRHPDMDSEVFKKMWKNIQASCLWHGEIKNKTKDGRHYWVDTTIIPNLNEKGKIIGYSSIRHDITTHKETLEKNVKQHHALQQQSKLASMGEMIGAIAHQWRQPLNAISTGIQNLEYDYEDGLIDAKFIDEFIEKQKKTIQFMSKTIDDFRGFFRIDKDKQSFALLKATKSVIDMQSSQLKKHNISLKINGEEFSYFGLQSEYQQVILNLINNAKDALVENNIENPSIHILLQNNEITVQDNAGGIPKDLVDRIFEPYFTTKEQGKGTGMGLYMCKMIIEENMGEQLKVKNIDGGARFSIKFKK